MILHKYIKEYATGSDIIIHPESTENLKSSIKEIKDLNKKAGVSLNPDTPIETILNDLNDIDLILVMSVFPGFGGQKFMPEVLKKIDELSKLRTKNNFNYKIEVDGGIDFSNSKKAIEAGADILVSGTTIFKENNGDLKKNIEILRNP